MIQPFTVVLKCCSVIDRVTGKERGPLSSLKNVTESRFGILLRLMAVAWGFMSSVKPSGTEFISMGCLELQVTWAPGRGRDHVSGRGDMGPCWSVRGEELQG